MKARICIALVAGCLAGLFSMAQGAGAATLQPVGTFSNPIYITSPPGDPRLFVVERGGTIEVVHDGVQSQFLDIHELTTEEGERGLLSMAFDPNYAKNGLFYVFYTGTAAADGQAGLGHVDEFHVSSNPNVADVATRRPVLTITRPSAVAANHNGGQLQFGRDGLLYISVGDGGTGGSTAPNLGLLNGKILRIDPHGAAPGAYSIPAGNPYALIGHGPPRDLGLGVPQPVALLLRRRHRGSDRRRGRRGRLGGDRPGTGARHRARRQLRLAGLRGLRRELPGDDPSGLRLPARRPRRRRRPRLRDHGRLRLPRHPDP